MDTITPFQHNTISPSQGEIANVTGVQYTISPSQGDIASMISERQISSDIITEPINGFNELTIKSTINNSEEDEAETDPNSNPKVANYTTNGNYPYKLILNRLIPEIIPGAIRPIDQTITEEVEGIRETLDAHQMVLLKEIVTDTASSGAHILRSPREVSRTDRDGTTPQYGKNAVAAAFKFVTVPPNPQTGIRTKRLSTQ